MHRTDFRGPGSRPYGQSSNARPRGCITNPGWEPRLDWGQKPCGETDPNTGCEAGPPRTPGFSSD